MRNKKDGEWNYDIDEGAKPETLNWTAGGDANQKPPIVDADHYFRWRKYYPYCAGLLSDLFPHKLHPYMLATGNPEFPLRGHASAAGKWKRTNSSRELTCVMCRRLCN